MILDNFKIFKKSPLFKIWLKSKVFLEIYFLRCSKISHFKKSGSPLTNLWSIFNKIFQNHLKSSSLKIKIFFEFSDIPKNIYYDKKSCFGQFGDLEKVSTFLNFREFKFFFFENAFYGKQWNISWLKIQVSTNKLTHSFQ